MRWPYDKRAESAHAWGALGLGAAGAVGISTVLATLHATDPRFRWWWPTDWMALPVCFFLVGIVLLLVPLRQSRPKNFAPAAQDSTPKPQPLRIATERTTGTTGEEDQLYISPEGHPSILSERQAVMAAYADDIEQAASCLKNGLSVLVRCDKILDNHLSAAIISKSGRSAWSLRPLVVDSGKTGSTEPPLKEQLIDSFRHKLAAGPGEEVLIISQLDLLVRYNEPTAPSDEQEFAELIYSEGDDRSFLAFADPSTAISKMLLDRFAARITIGRLPRTVRTADGTLVPMGRALVTQAEADLFEGFEALAFHRHVAGMNAVQLRHALRFAYLRYNDSAQSPTLEDLIVELQTFGARVLTFLETPEVTFDQIGGYSNVKAEFVDALQLIAAGPMLSPSMARELIPKGFIIYGPPGIGKTLFAKAIASQLDATVMIVSGPEELGGHVGEAEQQLAEIFADARRDAPAVLIFDEIDTIARKSADRRAGISNWNSVIVARLLTELGKFRAEVPVLVIGTTNQIDILDPRLLRSNHLRFIKMELPGEEDRKAIIRVQSKYYHIAVSEELMEVIARATEGMSGDEIHSIFLTAFGDELRSGRRADSAYLEELIRSLKRKRAIEDNRAVGGDEGSVI